MNPQDKSKGLRAVFRRQWKRAIVDLTSKTARIHSHICTLNFAEERCGSAYTFPGLNMDPLAGKEAILTLTLGYQLTASPPAHSAPFCLLLSITINAKATINREVSFILLQYPRAS